jgi:hypothetical protein
MAWLVLLLLVAAFVALIAYSRREPPVAEPVDPEQALKAAVELHRIRRNLDAAWTKQEQRRCGARLCREIAEALEDDERP